MDANVRIGERNNSVAVEMTASISEEISLTKIL